MGHKLYRELCRDLAGVLYNAAEEAAAAVSYLLKASFNADNQSFTDGQVLDSAAEGVETGALTVHEKSVAVPGAVEILSNQVKITNGDEWYKDGLQYQTGFARAIGAAWFCSADGNPAGGSKVFFINNNTGLASSAHDGTCEFRFGRVHYYTPSLGGLQVMTDQFTSGTQIRMAIVLGGYDVNGIPYKNGDTKANFTYGYSLFVKGDMFTEWTLMYRSKEYSSATIYPYLTHKTDLATITKIEDFNIPDVDLSTLLEPVVFDTFTDTDTTPLASHTPDVDSVGGGWSVPDGVITIVGNETKASITNFDWCVGVIDTGKADIVGEIYTKRSAGVNSNDVGFVLRYVDVNNYWIVTQSTNASIKIYEYTSAVKTERAADNTGAYADDAYHRLVCTADDDTISLYIDNTKRITYAAATAHKTSTKHGIFDNMANTWIDNVAFWPRGVGAEYSDLENY